jgi:DNA-binding response OmpR family regulator
MIEHATRTHAPLSGWRILLVEDNALIALDSQDTLLEAGATFVHIATTLSDAMLRLADVNAYDAAVVDIDLGNAQAFPIADLLLRQGIPFLFSTGHARSDVISARYSHIPVLTKPTLPQAMIAGLAMILMNRQ